MPCSKCGTDGHNIRTCTWKKPKTPKRVSKRERERETEDCCVCYEQLGTAKGTVTTPCGHNYCAPCFANWMRKSGTCAYCREEICEAPPVKNQPISDDVREQFIDELLEGEMLTAEVGREIQLQIVRGIHERYGRNAPGVDSMIGAIEDTMEKDFNLGYIMSIIGYDAISIVSEHYEN